MVWQERDSTMVRVSVGWRVVPAVLALALCALLPAGAWAAQASGNRAELKDIKFNVLRTPKYDVTTDPRAKSENDWLQVQLEYETSGGRDGWIDEVTLEWAVQVSRPGKNILLRKTVSYVDVADGAHFADMYIRPGFGRRYGENRKLSKGDLRVHVQVRVNGVKMESFRFPREKSDNWWEAEAPAVLVKDELLPRSETPFAPLDYDFYEHTKPAGRGALE